MPHRITIQVQGLVQGVGFRPFVWRLARELALRGSVANNTSGVEIVIECDNASAASTATDETRLRLFLDRLRREAPPAATIHDISINEDGKTPNDVTPFWSAVAEGAPATGDTALRDSQSSPSAREPKRCRRSALPPHSKMAPTETATPATAAAAAPHSDSDSDHSTFFILHSTLGDGSAVAEVAPDIAVCPDCLRDRETQPHRLGYPFINCTNCGPRFSLIKDLPYDRPRTTMAEFEMCPICRREYEDPADRRFHAQPIACNHCGPTYYAYDASNAPASAQHRTPEKITDYPRLLALTARQLDAGGIVAIKGIGGYHLACDATNPAAVRRLRELKRRDTKPFAVLFPDAQTAALHVEITPAERAALESWRRPIVLLRQWKWKWKRRPAAFSESAFSESGKMPLPLSPDINPGMTTLGCLLPYMPLHHDLFRQLATPALVFTSGNITDTPIAIDEAAAEAQFGRGSAAEKNSLDSGLRTPDTGPRTPDLTLTSNLNLFPPPPPSSAFGLSGFQNLIMFLHHNREIHNRVDDSVVQIYAPETTSETTPNNAPAIAPKTTVLRRSRGYAPEPFFADVTTEGILAFGAEKTASFALGRDRSVLLSQHIGDLQNAETLAFYEESLARYQRLFRFTPRRLVCDLHPDYLSTRAAEKMAAENNLSLLRVQHHHAHAAACMLEHRLHAPLIAVVWDATGLGDDGTIWGGEFFHCDRARYTRLAHLENVPMPGGDAAALEPWRMAHAWLRHHNLYNLSPSDPSENFSRRVGPRKTAALDALLAADINCPQTSSAGRLFDALASLLGLCDTATRQAEAPTLLEQHALRAARETAGASPYPITAAATTNAPTTLGNAGVPPADEGRPDPRPPHGRSARRTPSAGGTPALPPAPITLLPLFAGVLADLRDAVPTPLIAAKIHETLARLIVETIARLQRQTHATEALITGGCFQNKLLTERVMTLCFEREITLHIPETLPCNDSGVAAGQLAIATARNPST